MCHKPGSQVEIGLSRPFVSAPYVEEDGRWRPVAVSECPYGEGCRITEHDYRPRKTGPGHPLAVKRCHVHMHYFTVYPPGQVPYGRQRIAPVTSAGLLVRAESETARWRRSLPRGGGRRSPGPLVADRWDRGGVHSGPFGDAAAPCEAKRPATGSID